MKIVGMIRYSLPAGFAAKRFDENFDVFGEPYFSQRLNLFKSITLPSLAGQTDKDFQVIVYHSDAILENKKKIFDDLEKSYPFLKNVYLQVNNLLLHHIKKFRIIFCQVIFYHKVDSAG